MAKSTQSANSGEPRGVGSRPAAKRATSTAGRQPTRSAAKRDAPKASDRHRPPEPISRSAHPVLEPPPAVSAATDPAQPPSEKSASAEPTTAQPAPSESPIAEPTMAPPAEARAAIAEPTPAPSSHVDEPLAPSATAAALPEPVAAAAELALASAALPWPGRSLVESNIRIRSEMIAFTWRQTEQGVALGRAMLASRSLPELFALQTAYFGETLERTLTHTLELARLSTDLLRAGLQPPRAD